MKELTKKHFLLFLKTTLIDIESYIVKVTHFVAFN